MEKEDSPDESSKVSTSPSNGGSRRASLMVKDRVPKEHQIPATDVEQYAVKSGYLHKRGGGIKSKAWKKRWFCLSGQALYYYKSEKHKRPQGVIHPLKEYLSENEPDFGKDKYQFKLVPKPSTPNTRTFYIYANSQTDKVDWMEALRYACEGGTQSKTSLEIEEKLRKNCYDIPANDLEWSASDVLGKGASGVVRKGVWLKTTEVAVKGLNNVPEFTEHEEMVGFFKEIEMLSQLRHPNIVPMFGYCKKDGYLCLVTEWVKGGDLSSGLHSKRKIDLHLKVELCISICRGMVYLHNKKIVHRDLKPQNILVESLEEAKVKVCDFGLSTITKGKEEKKATAISETETFGSPAYAAPELPTPTHTFKVDVFSFGVIMWEIYHRKLPWNIPEITHGYQITERVARGERLPFEEPNGPLNSVIDKCWDQDPDKRPTFTELYEDLERLKTTLPKEQPKSDDKNENRKSLEEQLLEGFGEHNALTWDNFTSLMSSVFRVGAPMIEKLRYMLEKDEMVSKDTFKTFLTWFSPLTRTTTYNTEQQEDETNGYDIEMIIDIVGPGWFFGFLNPAEAKEILQKRPYGTFLFRFSSTPGCYTLSVNYGQVGHWRIVTEKTGPGYPIFKIDERPYKSLYHIIETHTIGGEPLTVKGSDLIKTCFLKDFVDREPEGDDETQGHYESLY